MPTNVKNNKLEVQSSDWIMPKPISLMELMATTYRPIQWLVEDLIPAAAITVISGDGGTFKSYLMLHLAACLVSGDDFLNQFQTIQSGVLFVDEENDYPLFQQRLKPKITDSKAPVRFLYGSNFVVGEHSVEQVIAFCKEHNINTVVFDSLVAMLGSADENIGTDIRQVFKNFRSLKDAGIAVIVIQHNRKMSDRRFGSGQEIRGSSDIRNAADCHIGISLKGDEIIFDQSKNRGGKRMDPFMAKVIQLGDNDLSFDYIGLCNSVKQVKSAQVPEIIIGVLSEAIEPLNKTKLISVVISKAGVSKSTIAPILEKMINANEVLTSKGKLKNSLICSLPELEVNVDLTS